MENKKCICCACGEKAVIINGTINHICKPTSITPENEKLSVLKKCCLCHPDSYGWRCDCKCHTEPKEVVKPLPQANDWVSIEKEFYNLYLEGRKKYKAPINYIDYFEARHFITKTLATQKAKDREELIEWCDKYLEEHFSKALVALKEFLNK